jgi:microcystin-dependent protein
MTFRMSAVALVIAFGLASRAAAATPVPYAFSAGAPARAAEVNANFQAVVEQISAAIPPGTVLPYAGTTAPPGFLLCNGASVSSLEYPALAAVVGVQFGIGVELNTFKLPDLRSRIPVGAGQGPGLTDRALAATGGEESHALTLAEMAAHGHPAASTQAAHKHRVQSTNGTNPTLLSAGTGFASWNNGATGFTDGNNLVETAQPAITTTVDVVGSGAAHGTMPPFLVLNWIIKT